MEKLFRIVLALIILFHFLFHYTAITNNNFHFTIDQGNDALFVRDIVERHALPLKGPETSIRGIYAGPLWYYFLVPGYILFDGHPQGSIYTLVFLNAALLLLIIILIKKRVGVMPSLMVGCILLFSWFFFETSLYSFNPFPTLATTFIRLFLLIEFLLGKKRYYYWAVLVTLLTFNFDVAIAVVLTIFTYVVGLWGVKTKVLSVKEYAIASFALPALPVLFLSQQMLEVFWRTKIISSQHAGLGVFSGTNIWQMLLEFFKMIGTVTPFYPLFGNIAFFGLLFFFFKRKDLPPWVKSFVLLTGILTIISLCFFASNRGWRSWHTVYLPPMILVSFILMLTQLKKRFVIPIFLIVISTKVAYFQKRLINYKAPSADASILYNELGVIDWVYDNSESQGFKAYNYTNTFYDDPYQYLFWWHGLKKYNYLPDEYANFPLAHKELYVPGYRKYLEPKRTSDRIAFLIIQSDNNGETNNDWLTLFRENHTLMDETTIGEIKVEKYYRKIDAPSDVCIWRKICN